ncbi:hypothetical protein B0H13DRAFT_287515 [Mycena leptocephala]|nr:hypothetical protein B0H13DRAFT_287515 [Mycena leptocephala]
MKYVVTLWMCLSEYLAVLLSSQSALVLKLIFPFRISIRSQQSDHPTVPQLISSRFSAEGRSFSQQIPGCGLRIKGSDPISPPHPSHPQITPRSVWVSVLLCATSGHQIETLR